jgi:methyl-accepting chemotaxis protein
MIKLRNHSIHARLMALGALATLAMLLIGGAGLWTQGRARANLEHFVSHEVEALSQLGSARAGVGNLRRYEKDTLINLADAKAVDKYRKDWASTYDKVQAALGQMEALDLGPAIGATVAESRHNLAAYREGFGGFAERVAKGEFADTAAANQGMEPIKAPVRALDKALGELGKLIEENAQGRVKALAAHDARAQQVLIAVLLLGVIALALFLRANSRSIVKPLQTAVGSAERIARQDLTGELDARGRDETAALMRGLSDMQSALTQVVRDVRGSTDSIATASREVAAGAMDLSQRTEQAAANLQRTASAMDELTASVRHNADSARQANGLASEAAGVAQQGGQAVGDVVATMERISASAKKIGDIISVIDGIAFQTNILALNAAVEAARAGEQGRGFAVVASEVRSLAGRSAEAAKEIKALITASTESVESGTAQVAVAGQTMQGILASIGRVSQIVGEISHATTEQSAGIQQVGQSIAELDQMTQQNAALVEESAAAASSLQQQADDLATAVSVFKLG